MAEDKPEPLGLRAPIKRDPTSYFISYFGQPVIIEEARDTFIALVPDRFKTPPKTKD